MLSEIFFGVLRSKVLIKSRRNPEDVAKVNKMCKLPSSSTDPILYLVVFDCLTTINSLEMLSPGPRTNHTS